MTRRSVVIGLWLAFVVVVWNVVFDRLVWTAATEFTREQVTRYQAGQMVASIHEGFSPRLRAAAWQASLWTLPLVLTAGGAIYLSGRRAR